MKTEAWGGVAKGPFLNRVVQLENKFNPEQLFGFDSKKIEDQSWKKTSYEHWGGFETYWTVDNIFTLTVKWFLTPFASKIPIYFNRWAVDL